MTSEKRKLELVKEALHALKSGELTEFGAIIAISIIVDPEKPSKECMEWAKKVAREHEQRNIDEN